MNHRFIKASHTYNSVELNVSTLLQATVIIMIKSFKKHLISLRSNIGQFKENRRQ